MLYNFKLKFLSLVVGLFIGFFIAFLLVIIGITIFNGLTSQLCVEQLTMLTTTIMALASIILAIITGCYAYTTHKILDEQKKLRQISDIEKQLEKLYYPLMDILKNPCVIYFVGGKKDYCIDLKKIDEIVPFQHLASDEFKDLIENFIKIAFKERVVAVSDIYDVTKFDIVDESFKEKVEDKIDLLKKELQQIKNL